MAFEKLIPIKVTDAQGVSNQVILEDLPDQYFSSLQNMYERKLGELQRKGGTLNMPAVFPQGAPSDLNYNLNNALVLKKRDGSKIHLQSVSPLSGTSSPPTIPRAPIYNAVTMAFVNSGGNWGTALAAPPNPANTFLGHNGFITLQFVGFGLNFSQDYAVTRGGGTNTLAVTVDANMDARCLGINVYAEVDIWNGTNGAMQNIWVGYIDLNAPGSRGMTYDFSQAPVCQSGTNAVTGVMYGSTTKPTFTLEGIGGGSLVSGKTYYVSARTVRE